LTLARQQRLLLGRQLTLRRTALPPTTGARKMLLVGGALGLLLGLGPIALGLQVIQ
jgi:hypothetical protein